MPDPTRSTRRGRVAFLAITAAVAMVVTTATIAVAGHTFTDVPDSNTFHNDIAWMADSGVTRGCNPPANDEYCPSENVTREQMAAFLRRLSEGQVVDAGTLGGMDSSEFQPAGDYLTADDGVVPRGEYVPFNVEFTEPGEEIIATAGDLALSLVCEQGDIDGEADGDDTVLSQVIRTNGDAIVNFGGELSAGESFDVTAASEFDSTDTSAGSNGLGARDANGNYLGTDDYHGVYTVNYNGTACTGQGFVFVQTAS